MRGGGPRLLGLWRIAARLLLRCGSSQGSGALGWSAGVRSSTQVRTSSSSSSVLVMASALVSRRVEIRLPRLRLASAWASSVPPGAAAGPQSDAVSPIIEANAERVRQGKRVDDGNPTGRVRRVAPIAGLVARTTGDAVVKAMR